MKHNEKLAMCTAMTVYGGNFVKKLAMCFMAADNDNVKKLEGAFPDKCAQYLSIARANKVSLDIDYDIGAGQ